MNKEELEKLWSFQQELLTNNIINILEYIKNTAHSKFISKDILSDVMITLININEYMKDEKSCFTPNTNPKLWTKLEDMEFSTRVRTAIRRENECNESFIYIGDLVQRTEREMMYIPNFGRQSLNELKEVLAKMELHFGMIIPGWPNREDIRRFERIKERFKFIENKFLIKKQNAKDYDVLNEILCTLDSLIQKLT